MRWFFLLLAPAMGLASNTCDPYLEALGNRAFWAASRFTAPEAHDPKKYLYLVTAAPADPFDPMAVQFRSLMPTFLAPPYGVDVFSEPRRFHERPIISLSVITEKKPVTVYRQGAILRVPAANIYAATPGDMGSPRFNTRALAIPGLEGLMRKHGLPRPEEIVARMARGWNEAVAVGTGEDGAQVEVIGYFYIESAGIPIDTHVVEGLRSLATDLSVPLLRLSDS